MNRIIFLLFRIRRRPRCCKSKGRRYSAVGHVWNHEAKLSGLPLRMPYGIQFFLVTQDRQKQPLYQGHVVAVPSVASHDHGRNGKGFDFACPRVNTLVDFFLLVDLLQIGLAGSRTK